MSLRSDYAAAPFVAGSLFGVRNFTEWNGRLFGPVSWSEFHPGDNIAVHGGSNDGEVLRALGARTDRYGFAAIQISLAEMTQAFWSGHRSLAVQSGKRTGTLDCNCGFYANHLPEHMPFEKANFAGTQSVTAVIEGYGRAVVGELGWRSEKARLAGVVCAVDVADRFGVPSFLSVDELVAAFEMSQPIEAS